MKATKSLFQDALRLAREQQDGRRIANRLGILGKIAREEDDCPAAYALLDEAVELAAESGHASAVAVNL